MSRITLQDKLCILPLVQQVIGVRGLGICTVRAVKDVVKVIFDQLEIDDKQKELKLKAKSKNTEWDTEQLTRELGDVKGRLEHDVYLLKCDLKGIAKSFIRCIPLVGTLYSGYVWYKASHIKRPEEFI